MRRTDLEQNRSKQLIFLTEINPHGGGAVEITVTVFRKTYFNGKILGVENKEMSVHVGANAFEPNGFEFHIGT